VVGAEQVAKVMMGGRTWYPGYATKLIAMNGGTGVLVSVDGNVIGLIAVTTADGRITEIDMIVNPEKLRGAHAATGRA
jgi:RNA polymerase sigma-70 factor (ECF subfamily)